MLRVWNVTLVIYCHQQGKLKIENSDFYKKLSNMLAIKIIIIPDFLINGHKNLAKKSKDKFSHDLPGLLQTCLLIMAKKKQTQA